MVTDMNTVSIAINYKVDYRLSIVLKINLTVGTVYDQIFWSPCYIIKAICVVMSRLHVVADRVHCLVPRTVAKLKKRSD